MISTSTIRKGKELLFDYGIVGNQDLIKHYGYCVADNAETKLTIYVSEVISDKMIFFSREEGKKVKKFKIPYDSICRGLVKFWAKVHRQKIIKALPNLISQMKETYPPKMKNEDF